MEESEKIQLEIVRLQEQLDAALVRHTAARLKETGPRWASGGYLGRPYNGALQDRYEISGPTSGGLSRIVTVTTKGAPDSELFFDDMCAFVDGAREKIASGEIS